MKIDNFDYFDNKESGKKCLILGGAPSIKDIDIENFDGVIISMGDIPIRLKDKCRVDYWVNANAQYPTPDRDYKIINQFKDTTFIFSNSIIEGVRPIYYDIIKKELHIQWFEYDQKHFNKKSCNEQIDYRFDMDDKLNCCNHINDITIQEYIQKKFNTLVHYSTADTVAIHALAFAIIMGCKTIYIGGVEIPLYEKDYNWFQDNGVFSIIKDMKLGGKKVFLKKVIARLFNIKIKSLFYPDIPRILSDFDYFNKLCTNNNIFLYNLSKKSILNKITDFKYLNPSEINEK